MHRTLTISKSAVESAQRKAQVAGDEKAIAAAGRLLALIRDCRDSGYDAVKIAR